MTDIYFPVKKVLVDDIMPGFEHRSGLKHAIVITKPDGTERITQYCSDIYHLVPNNTIVPAFEQAISKYHKVEVKTRMVGWEKFYIDFILKDHPQDIGETDDKVFPRISLINSYDGSIKYNFIGGFFRQICLNGLMVPEGDVKQVKFMHTPSIGKETSFEAVMQMASEFIEISNDVSESYHELEEQPVKDWLMRIEEVVEATGFPKTLQEDVADRMTLELESVEGLIPTDWIVYNAFNYQLNHNEGLKAKQNKKDAMDQDVLEYLIKY